MCEKRLAHYEELALGFYSFPISLCRKKKMFFAKKKKRKNKKNDDVDSMN
jgi:hypothetical protein